MAVYFVPKSRILKAITFRQLPNKWPTKWTISRRTLTNRSSTGGQNLVGSQQQQPPIAGNDGLVGQQEQTKKGKFNYFNKKWSWKAGAGWTILSVLDWWLLAAGGWFTWRGLITKWTPLGVCLLAAIEWHLHKKDLEKRGLPRTASQLQMDIYCSLPLRLFSRGWGWLANCSVPVTFRPIFYGFYSKAFKVNLDEAANPELKDYRSLAEFFTRTLKEDVRCIDKNCALVSPADGKVLHFGLASMNDQIEQVKGVTYKLDAFLGAPTWIERKESLSSYVNTIKQHNNDKTSLYQCVIYLAPGDYHRFHSPTCWDPKIRRHFTGELLSVSPQIANWVPGLFCINERALYIGNWQHGFFSFTAVGATNVGSVQIYFDKELETNKWIGLKVGKHKATEYDEVKVSPGIRLEKGDLIGQFNMGSTIVLIFEAPKDFEFTILPGQTIKVGERLGYTKAELEKFKKTEC